MRASLGEEGRSDGHVIQRTWRQRVVPDRSAPASAGAAVPRRPRMTADDVALRDGDVFVALG